MKQLILLLFFLCQGTYSYAYLDRNLIRREILLHKLSSSVQIIDPYFEEEIFVRRSKRRAVDLPSDDEDIVSGEGSGSDYSDVSSINPTPSGASSTDWAWYRTTINFLDSIEYSDELQNYRTDAFASLAHEIMIAVEEYLKTMLDGYLEATPLMFSMDGNDVMVQIDVGICMTHSITEITKALESMVASEMIGSFRVSEDGFNIRQVGVDHNRRECKPGPNLPSVSPPFDITLPVRSTPDDMPSKNSTTPAPTPSTSTVPPHTSPCRFDQATCKNLQCIDRSYVCDGSFDCLDGSDEPDSCTNIDTTQCDPTEFLCVGTGVCAQKIWRCDGDNDCGNGFDEQGCPAAEPDSRCQATEFECLNRVCIPSSYQCDGEADCDDNSDEEGCTPPVVVQPPKRFVNATAGSTVTFHCEAAGLPNPVISWRVNWGNVPPPPRVTMTSQNGVGTLIIRKVKPSDQGAYTCEAMNTNGNVLGIPDGILTVHENLNPTPTPATTTTEEPPEPLPCPTGQFNIAPPGSPVVCKSCYCFGVTDLCTSSRLYYGEIGIEFTKPNNNQNVTLESRDSIDGVPETTRPITENQIRVNLPARELQLIDLSKRFLAAAHYWSLPVQFLGAKITSYGGTLKFLYSYNNSYHLDSIPTNHTDVILEGNGDSLFFKSKSNKPATMIKHMTQAKLEENDDWTKIDGKPATREDFMKVLNSLDRVLLRTVYDKSMLSTGIGDITMEVAGRDGSSATQSESDFAGAVEKCICPEGYQGLSCQECSPGYVRERIGSLIGKCVSSEEQGDSPTVHCEAGYTGPGCMECASGYVRFRGRCRPDIGHHCDSAGTADVGLDGECQCKDTTEGIYCENCRPGYYHLSDETSEGCLTCLCMGVTKSCSSSSWNYTTVSFLHNEPINVELISGDPREVVQGAVSFSENRDGVNVAESRLSDFANGEYYWSLPGRFIGNKLGSYGGFLGYTLLYTTTSNDADVRERFADVEMSGNGLTLFYSSNVVPQPNTDLVYDVQLKEENWRTLSGRGVTREQFLLVLSNVEKFIVFASQSNDIEISSIKQISLDEAKPGNHGNSQALAVENCICPPGYTGLSCEKCADGFYRIEGGSYLGTCQSCNCNGHSDNCDKSTGTCRNCLHNTIGDHCDACQPGFYGHPLSGEACHRCPCPLIEGRSDQLEIGTCTSNVDGEFVCDQCPWGYDGIHCERCSSGFVGNPPEFPCRPDEPELDCNCDPIGSVHERCDTVGQCVCKPSTTGKKCDQCKVGFFYMSVDNPVGGCLPCFCMGLTNQCGSSTYNRHQITSNFSENFGGFSLTQRNVENLIMNGFEISDKNQTLSYPRVDLLPRGGSYYWHLPEEYTGDKIVSYGGKLQYNVSYTTYGYEVPNDDPDVILIGNDITIAAHSTGNRLVYPDTKTERLVVFNEKHWFNTDGREATREHLLMVLADLEAILIRATYSTSTLRTSISDVAMEIASESVLMSEPAYQVEQCDCPNGYEGSSCEDCAPGFTRFGDGLYLGLCHLCQCNGHADLCDAESGTCFNCRDHTAGKNCDVCAIGYYGDATRGTSNDCRPCACPGTGVNSFSNSCHLNESSNTLICTACREGYTGLRCESCAFGYVGDPAVPGGSCQRRTLDLLEVDVTPKSAEVAKGESVAFRCNVNSPVHVTVEWRRSGSLPSNSIVSDEGRTLRLLNFSPSQAGTYECIVRSRHQTKIDSTVVTLQREQLMMKVKIEEPREMQVRVGSQVSFVCSATSKMPAYVVTWSKLNGNLPWSRVTDFDGILHIDNVQLSDAGSYVCIGSNMHSEDRETAKLVVVRGDEITMPSVEVSPRNQSVSVGEDAIFYCSASGYPTPTVEWTKEDGSSMPDDVHVVGNMLMISSASMRDRSRYLCRATNSHGFVEATAALDVVARGEPPYVTIVIPDVILTVGESKDLKCTSTGIPPPLFSWHKSDDLDRRLPNNANQFEGVLKIKSARLDNQGVYACTASNYFGRDTGYVRVAVKRKTIEGKPICRTEPKEVTAYVGTNSTVTCVVGGDPEPEVIWETENGLQLDHNIHIVGQKMMIENVRLKNAGNYVCVATNQKGVSRSHMTLVVVEKALPTVKILPNRYQRVKAGQDASFICLTPGQTDTDITWLRSDQNQFSGETFLSKANKQINFKNITLNEAGGYMCLASNAAGFKQVQVNITVLYPPLITISPTRFIDLAEGESLDLRCDVFGIPVPSVVWVNGTGPENPRMLTNYRLRSNLFRISNIRMHHAGDYYCRAINHVGNSQKKVALVVHPKVINSPPVVTVKPLSIQATPESSIQVFCTASGYPVPIIRWSKEGGFLPTGILQSNGTLFISNFTSVIAGYYNCLASNLVGVDMKSVEISLIERPVVRIESASHVFLTSGESINITCFALKGIPPPSIMWTVKLNASENVEVADNLMKLKNFDPERDSGTYTCTGMNVAGSTSIAVQMEVLDVPRIETEFNATTKTTGQSLTLNCYVTSDDGQFEVTWERADGFNLDARFTASGGTLNVADLKVNDSGQYICIGSNKAGSSYAAIDLEVQEIPTVELVFATNKDFFVEGEPLTIFCNTTGVPTPTLTLSKNDSALELEINSFKIESLTAEDSGVYSCEASNNAGQTKAQKVLQVFQPPSAFVDYSEVKVRSGNFVSVTCRGEGFPKPNITWKKLRGFLSNETNSNNGELVITKVRLTDQGYYMCSASNKVASSNKTLFLSVDAFIPYFTQTPLSFMSINVPNTAFYITFNITITFRPNSLDGLLLYSYSSNNDFLSISMADGIIEFRFNLGSGTVTIRSSSSTELDRWHTVTVSRIHRNGWLQLDNGPVVKGKSPGEFRGLELGNDLFVGGIPKSVKLPAALQGLGSDSGFYGCVSQLNFGSGFVDFGSPDLVTEKLGVVRCKTCGAGGDSPCLHQATCLETHQVDVGYVCNCSKGYVGKNCQFRANDLCAEDSCSGQGSCEVNLETDLGFICSCNQNFKGPRCSESVTTTTETPRTRPRVIGPFARGREIAMPVGMSDERSENNDDDKAQKDKPISFAKNSYIMSTGLRLTQRRRTDFTLRVKRQTRSDGLLLFNGNFSRKSSFLSLAFRRNALELRVNTGTESNIMRAPSSSIGVGIWHTIRTMKRRRRWKLVVDGRIVAKARFSGSDRLRLDRSLFIGGVAEWKNVAEKTNVRSGFYGCVESLRIGDDDVSLDRIFTKKNTGSCIITSGGSEINSRERSNSITIPPRYSARFSGASFASFENRAFRHDETAEQISIRFRSTEPYGLIMYHGEDLISELKKVSRLRHGRRGGRRRRAQDIDFVSLGVQKSHLVYMFNLGGGIRRAISRFPVTDGAWHTATIVRRGTLALMWIDDVPTPVAIQAPSSHSILNTPGRVYFGGTPDIIFSTAGRYSLGFIGCLREVRLTPISNTRSTELGSSYLNDSSTLPLDFSRSGTLERINLRRCLNPGEDER